MHGRGGAGGAEDEGVDEGRGAVEGDVFWADRPDEE